MSGPLLEKRQIQTENYLIFIRKYWKKNGYAPTVREIQEALGISAISVVVYWLEQLRRRGLICFEDGQSRTIRLPGQKVVFADELTSIEVAVPEEEKKN